MIRFDHMLFRGYEKQLQTAWLSSRSSLNHGDGTISFTHVYQVHFYLHSMTHTLLFFHLLYTRCNEISRGWIRAQGVNSGVYVLYVKSSYIYTAVCWHIDSGWKLYIGSWQKVEELEVGEDQLSETVLIWEFVAGRSIGKCSCFQLCLFWYW